MGEAPKIGILALQGAVGPHEDKLRSLGVTPVQVRRSRDLEGLKGIILPGGESTTMIHLLKLNELWDDLKIFVRQRPAWGVCAGAILLAKTVTSPSQQSSSHSRCPRTASSIGPRSIRVPSAAERKSSPAPPAR